MNTEFKKIDIMTMSKFEELTRKNALKVLAECTMEKISATTILDVVFMAKLSMDKSFTKKQMEEMSDEDIMALFADIQEQSEKEAQAKKEKEANSQ